MRDYAKVAPQFWTGQTGKALKAKGPEAVIVAMYLMTSPHANMIGVYHCPVAYIAIDTGLSIEGASKGLQSAIEAGFCTYDAGSDYVFVHEFAAYQVGEELDPKDKRCAGVRNELAKVPKGQCWRGFRARYAVPFNLPLPAETEQRSEAPSMPLRCQEQEQEQKKETTLLTQGSAFPAESPPALTLVEGSKPKTVPDCPHREVLALWAEMLPAMPQHDPERWRGTKAEALRVRWRETAVAKGWATQAEGLAYLRKLFAYVGQSRFLTGRAHAGPGRTPFVVELAWLVKQANWDKTIEGKYHTEAA